MAILKYDPRVSSGFVVVKIDTTTSPMTVVSVLHLTNQFFEPDFDRFVYAPSDEIFYIPNNSLEQTKSCSYSKVTLITAIIEMQTLGGTTQLGFNKIVYANGHIYLGGA